MPAVQTTYNERVPAAVNGLPANMQTYDADTLICDTAAGIPFGRVVGQGSSYNRGVLGAATAAAFRGISVRDVTLDLRDPIDVYKRYDNMAVMFRGDIWVVTGGAVLVGEDVTFAQSTGILSSAAAGASQFVIAGARWMTAAGSGSLAIVRLAGPTPAA